MRKVLFLFVALFMLSVSCSYGGDVEKYTYIYDLRKVFMITWKAETGDRATMIGYKIPIDESYTHGYQTTSLTMWVHEKDQIQEIPYVVFDFRSQTRNHFNYKYHISKPIINEENVKVYDVTTGGIATPLLGIRVSKEECKGTLMIIKTGKLNNVLDKYPELKKKVIYPNFFIENFSKGGHTAVLTIDAEDKNDLMAVQYYFDAYRMSN